MREQPTGSESRLPGHPRDVHQRVRGVLLPARSPSLSQPASHESGQEGPKLHRNLPAVLHHLVRTRGGSRRSCPGCHVGAERQGGEPDRPLDRDGSSCGGRERALGRSRSRSGRTRISTVFRCRVSNELLSQNTITKYIMIDTSSTRDLEYVQNR